MKICIIGPEKRTETEIELLERAQSFSDSVLYAPIEKIRIETFKEKNKSRPFYKNIDLLDFDLFIPLVNKANADFCYVLLQIFEQNGKMVSISSSSVLYGYNEFLLPFVLKNGGIPTPRTYLSMSRTAVEKSIETMIYPAILKLPYSKAGTIVLDNKSSAKGVIDTLETLNQPITLQETFEDAKALSVLMIGNDSFAIEGKSRPYKLSKKDHNVMLSLSNLMDSWIFQVNLIKTNENIMVVGFNIRPKIEYFSRIYEMDLFKKSISFLSKKVSVIDENPIFSKILEWVHEKRWK